MLPSHVCNRAADRWAVDTMHHAAAFGLKDMLLGTLCRTDKLEPLGEALPILEFARAETQKRAPHLTHPLLCLDAIRTGIEEGGLAGLRQVCFQVMYLMASNTCMSSTGDVCLCRARSICHPRKSCSLLALCRNCRPYSSLLA